MDSGPVPNASSTSTDGKNGNLTPPNDAENNETKRKEQFDVTDCPSNASFATTSEILRTLDQGFASYLSTNVGLKRLDTTPDIIPRFFKGNVKADEFLVPAQNLPSRTASNVTVNIDACDDCCTVTDTPSSSGYSMQIGNDVSFVVNQIPGNPPVTDETFLAQANDGRNERGASRTTSPKTSLPGFCGIFGEGFNSTPKPYQESASSLPADPVSSKSSIVSCTGSLDGKTFSRPHVVSCCKSSNQSVLSNASNENPTIVDLLNFKKTKSQNPSSQDSSHCSLQEIESFHLQFVGNLPLLSMFDTKGEAIRVDKMDSHNHQEELSQNCTPVAEKDQPKASTTGNILEAHLEALQTEYNSSVAKAIAKPEDSLDSCSCISATGVDDEAQQNSTTSMEFPTIPPEAFKSIDENIKNVVSKYVDFLEQEWKRRREIWLKNNKHNPKSKKKSIYAYETFKECVADRKINLQVPFDLPEVNESSRNPVLKDKVIETPSQCFPKDDSTEKKKPVPKSKPPNDKPFVQHEKEKQEDTNKTCNTNSCTVENVLGNYKKTEKHVNVMTKLQTVPLNFSPFLDECRGLWEDLKNIQPKPSEPKLEEPTVENSEQSNEIEKPGIDLASAGQSSNASANDTDNKSDSLPRPTDTKSKPPLAPSTKIPTKNTKPKPSTEKAVVDDKKAKVTKPVPKKSKSPAGKRSSQKEGKNVEATKLRKSQDNTKANIAGEVHHTGKVQFEDPADGSNLVDERDEFPKDDNANEPLVEIYRGLSRENTVSSIKNKNREKEEYRAFVNGRTVVCNSLEQKTRLDICCLKLNSIQPYAANLKDLSTLPGSKVLEYLSLTDFMNCRLVCKNWNNAVIACKKFLSTTTVIASHKPLGALATLEASRVRWQNIRCSVIPSMNLTAPSYNARFLSSNLRVTPASTRREPLTNTLTTIIFENFDIHKQQLVQWIQNCKRLAVIEVRNCHFLKTTISMNMDKITRVIEKVQVMKFSDMDVVKLAEALRFFLPATKRLHTLEIIQKQEVKTRSATLTARKGAEDEVAAVLCPALKRNAKTLKNILFEFKSAKNYLLQSRVIEALGSETFQLNTLIVRSMHHINSQPCLKIDSYNSPKHLTGLLRTTLNSSTEMTLLDFPMLAIDFVNAADGAWLLPSKVEKLAVQLEMPVQEKFNTDVEFPYLRELELYGSPLEDFQWYHVKQTMKGLTHLVVHCLGIRDSHFQSIIQNLKSLRVLRLESVQDVTDFGITGVEKGWIDRLRMYWPEKIDMSSEQFPSDKIRFVGKSLRSLEDLHTFTMKGDFSISNVGILYGFHSRELTTLELTGSPLNVSNSGLFILGFQCPQLRHINMCVQHSKANNLGVRDLYESLANRNPETFHIDVLSCQTVDDEPKVPMLAPC